MVNITLYINDLLKEVASIQKRLDLEYSYVTGKIIAGKCCFVYVGIS